MFEGLRPDRLGRPPESEKMRAGKAEPFRTSGGEAARKRFFKLRSRCRNESQKR